MQFNELKRRFRQIEKLNQVTAIEIDNINKILNELELLKEYFISTYFEFTDIDDYKELEDIKIKIMENILLCRLSEKTFLGISDKNLERELDDFYQSNGRVY